MLILMQSAEFCRPRGEVRSHDTIAMVAIDQYGNVAAATSTNGATNKIPGRWAAGLSAAHRLDVWSITEPLLSHPVLNR